MTNAERQKGYDRRNKLAAMFEGFYHVCEVEFHALASLHNDPMEMIPVAVCKTPSGLDGFCDIIGKVDGEFVRILSKDCDIMIPTSFGWPAHEFETSSRRFGITFGGAAKAAKEA